MLPQHEPMVEIVDPTGQNGTECRGGTRETKRVLVNDKRHGVLDRDNVNLELGVDAQRRESPLFDAADNGFLGRATLGW